MVEGGASGQLVVDVGSLGPDVHAELLSFSDYPDQCQLPVPFFDGPGTDEVEIDVDSTCRHMTLAITRTNPAQGENFTVSWLVNFEEAEATADLGFENGTLAGWTIVDSGDGTPGSDPLIEIVEPGLAGNYAARITTSSQPEDGLSIVIDPGSNACQMTVLASGSVGSVAVLEVYDAQAELVVRDEYTFTGEEPGPIVLNGSRYYFPWTDVTVRLLYGGTSNAPAVLTFDQLEVWYCT